MHDTVNMYDMHNYDTMHACLIRQRIFVELAVEIFIINEVVN